MRSIKRIWKCQLQNRGMLCTLKRIKHMILTRYVCKWDSDGIPIRDKFIQFYAFQTASMKTWLSEICLQTWHSTNLSREYFIVVEIVHWYLLLSGTVYPKKYAHGFCFAVLCCDYTLSDFPISIRLTSLALWQSNDCPSASKSTPMNMDKYFMWIHYERLHNHNKA